MNDEFVTIYKMTLPTRKIYVGQTEKTPAERLWQHILDSFNEGNRSYNSPVHVDIRKYCNDAPIVMAVLQERVPKKDKLEVERDWIWELHSNDSEIGYNKYDGREVCDRAAYMRGWRAANPEYKQKQAEYGHQRWVNLPQEKKDEYNANRRAKKAAREEQVCQ